MRQSLKHILPAAALMALAVFQIGCAGDTFSPFGKDDSTAATPQATPSPAPSLPDLTFIDDSFERTTVAGPSASGEAWSGLIMDASTAVNGFSSPGALMTVPPSGQFGPAFDGNQFLLVSGGVNDNNKEVAYLVSQTFDLSEYNSVILSYHYLTFGLTALGANYGVVLQVCSGSSATCGVGGTALTSTGMLSSAWITPAPGILDNSAMNTTFNDAGLNGHNQTVADWQLGAAIIDLTNSAVVSDPSTFTFRFVITMQNKDQDTTTGTGSGGTCTCKKEEAAAVVTADWSSSGGDTQCKDDDGDDNPGGDNYSAVKTEYFTEYCPYHHGYHHHDCHHHTQPCPKPSPTPTPKPTPTPTPTCTPTTTTLPNPGSNGGNIIDGAALDLVTGIATQKTINQLE